MADHAEADAGAWPRDSWPVGALPDALASEAEGGAKVVVTNAQAIGHAADRHPTTPSDWARVQQLAEAGEAWRNDAGELVLYGRFDQDGGWRTWELILKPVDGAWRLKTLHQASPRRRASVIGRGARLVRAGALMDRGE